MENSEDKIKKYKTAEDQAKRNLKRIKAVLRSVTKKPKSTEVGALGRWESSEACTKGSIECK
jgi:hypothetical protein